MKKSQKISFLKLFFDDLIERNDKGEKKKKKELKNHLPIWNSIFFF